jgi:transposase
MSRATKTIRQQLDYRPEIAGWFGETKALFNRVTAFYFEVIEDHPEVLHLDGNGPRDTLERLTHRTKTNPEPIIPLATVADNIPALMRRAAIQVALGAAHSFHSNLARWRKEKEQALAKGKKFKKHPPAPPSRWNKSVTFYSGMWKQRTATGILLKLWTGTSWCWVKLRIEGRELPEDWAVKSPQLVQQGKRWWLHTFVEKDVSNPHTVKEQVTSMPEVKVCSVKLGTSDSLAVCTIQTREGTTLATRFIRGGSQLNGLRKSLLGRIARHRNETGLIAGGEQDNARLWNRVRNLDEQVAHRVSLRIVEFARAHGATLLVFEHLIPYHPKKGSFSQRGNEKCAYWLRSKIFRYSQYKAWAEGIITCRVSPRDTGHECANCKAQVARYSEGQATSGYTPGAPLVLCAACGMRGNADRNASINIGQRLFARYQPQEKPRTPSLARRPSKEGGVPFPQAAESGGRPLTEPARHGEWDGHGTARG